MRRRDPQRIHEARRAAHVAGLVHFGGMPQDAAEAAVVAWEAKVEAEGRQRDEPGYWEGRDEGRLAARVGQVKPRVAPPDCRPGGVRGVTTSHYRGDPGLWTTLVGVVDAPAARGRL